MKPVDCKFESEALAAALQSRWPDRVDPALRTHIENCAICADVVAIAAAVDNAREEMRAEAVVPDSGRVWWLAQLRARREAQQAAGRPITAVQVIALACAMGLLGACFGATNRWFQSALAGLKAPAILTEHGVLLLAVAAALLLIPAAVYLAICRD